MEIVTVTSPRKTAGRTSDAVDLLALDRQVCFALAVASRRVIGLYRPLLEPMGLTHPQYLVMLALWEQEPLRVSELAERLSLEPATLSPSSSASRPPGWSCVAATPTTTGRSPSASPLPGAACAVAPNGSPRRSSPSSAWRSPSSRTSATA